ncbi:hypothetical protein [Kineothrix sp. MB12-C1]|uniref:hypothetical protein n=1 Tax=Kineothrix sp. MB12-C1 TaxID=3070215 RepID=UPI0027D292E0|nr:hypothetical protein [Kineothrix sp. MB12-C1]WMC92266.1 hypothetical protein RBB56_15655 [Kineothrix sp. MB12-C1]
MSEEIPKAKRGRPRKKPDYDRNEQIDVLLENAVDLFGEPFDDRKECSKDAPSIRDVANAMDTTLLKIRKILITTGHYSTNLSRKVQSLREQGCSIQQIMKQTGLKRASVHAYLPYSRGSYNLSESSLNAERKRICRKRKIVCERLCQNINSTDVEEHLWDVIVAFADYPFKTETGLPMKYTVEGGEVFFNRKEKSVTRATVMRAFMKARQIQKAEGYVSGPKRRGTFGASYLYPIFLWIGVCSSTPSSKGEN